MVFELTSNQKSIWYDQLLNEGSALYNVGGYVSIRGNVNEHLFIEAIDILIKNNDALRIKFHQVDDIPQLDFVDAIESSVNFKDFSKEDNPLSSAMNLMTRNASQPIDLNKQKLFFFQLLKVEENHYFWHIKLHHLISDGWSISLMVNKLGEIYTNLANKNTINLAKQPSYQSCIEDDQNYLSSEIFRKDRAYWIDKLDSFSPINIGSPQKGKHKEKVNESERLSFIINRNVYTELENFSKSNGSSVFHLFLAAIYVYFSRSLNRSDINIGLPILNRGKATFKKTLGLFAGITPLRMNYENDVCLIELLEYIKNDLRENFRHQRFPIDEISRILKLKEKGIDHLFEIALSYEKHDYSARFNGFSTESVALPHCHEKLPLAIYIREYSEYEDVKIDVDYNLSYWEKFHIQQFVKHFEQLIKSLPQNPQTKISEVDILPEADKIKQLEEWNLPVLHSEQNTTIVEVFEQQVKLTPENTALICGDSIYTYSELNEKSNQVAHYLRANCTIQTNKIIGVIADRSHQSIISILGILKSGAAYLPIDPSYPQERIKYMLRDSKVEFLLSEKSSDSDFYLEGIQVLALNDLLDEDQWSRENPNRTATGEDLCYVIYTSGSTGQAKGVMVHHAGFVNMSLEQIKKFDVNENDVCLQFASFSFDASASEIFMALFSGASLLITPENLRNDAVLFENFIQQNKVTVLTLPPSYLSQLSESNFAYVKSIVTAGEPAIKKDALRFGKGRNYFNAYGPTETSVCASIYKFHENSPQEGILPIGKPIQNITIHILDAYLNLLPIGSTGELYVGGIGVAKGYLNNKNLTDEKFIVSPFDKTVKLYKTGDLARYLPDGNIEFIGRIDDQIKVRGHRIELGEIEVALLRNPLIQEVAVIVKENKTNEKILVVFYVSENEHIASDLRNHLKTILPTYMLPDRFECLKQFPLTQNGKIDRKALTDLEISKEIKSEQDFVAAQTKTEIVVEQLWKELLGVEKIGIYDNFFELGGHSLKATQFIARLQKQENVHISLAEVFELACIHDIADLIQTKIENKHQAIQLVEDDEFYELTPAQKRIWIQEQTTDKISVYNIPLAVILTEDIQIKTLQKAIEAIVNKHEALRTSFVKQNGVPFQKIHPHIQVKIEDLGEAEKFNYQDLTALIHRQINHRFDLAEAPLFKISLVKLEKERFLFLFTIHHLIADGWSMKILLDELTSNYRKLTQNKDHLEINSLPIQYQDYASWVCGLKLSEKGQKEKKYWLNKLSGKIQDLILPLDFERTMAKSFQGKIHRFSINSNLKEGLKRLCHEQKTSLFVVLQAAVKVLLYKICNQNDIIVGTPVAGRTQEETEQIIGLFVNTLALRDIISGDSNASEFINQVKITSLEAIENQSYPYDELLEELDLKLKPNRNPLFDVLLTMDDQNFDENNGFYTVSDPLIRSLELEYNVSKFDLTFSFDTRGDDISVSLVFNKELYKAEKVALFGTYLQHVIRQFVLEPQKRLSSYQLSDGEEKELFSYLKLDKKEFESVYPLTNVQRDIYLTSVLDPEGSAMRPLAYFIIQKELDPRIWETSLKQFSQREPVLRTVLIQNESEIFQAVQRKSELDYLYIDMSESNLSHSDFDQLINKYMFFNQDVSHSLIKHGLFKINEKCFLTALTAHHVLLDGTSYKTFYETLDEIYGTLINGNKLSEVKQKPFKSFVFENLNRFDTLDIEAFWKKHLASVEPLSYSGEIHSTDKQIKEHVIIGEQEAELIKHFCRKNKITADVYFKSLYTLLVHYYCNADHEFCIRENLYGRTRDYMNAVGCFMHTMPLRIETAILNGTKTFEELCHHLKQEKEAVKMFKEISLSLQNRIIGDEKLSFFYNYQKFLEPKTNLELGILQQLYHLLDSQIEIRVAETLSGFEIKLDYNQSVFNGAGFVQRLIQISNQVIQGNKKLADIEYVNSTEKEILLGFNPQESEFDDHLNIIDLFEQQVLVNPNKIALVFENSEITYSNLDQKVNVLAAHLRNKYNLQAEDLVGIMLDRSEWMIIALLAVLKNGGAYLPIDSEYPDDRIEMMLTDSKTKLLITQEKHRNRVYTTQELVLLEQIDFTQKIEQLPRNIESNTTAYIIYTSGTTGQAKGVQVAHKSLTNVAFAWRKAYHLEEMEVNLLQMASFSFDVFTGDVIRALTNGGKLIICPKDTRIDLPALYELLSKHEISLFEATPALIVPLMEYIYENQKDIHFLKLLILGSDICPLEHFKKLLDRFGSFMRIINSYGVTEATIDSSFYEATAVNLPNSGNTPIGKPIQNTYYYVKNKADKLVSVGIPGELYIGGHGVAKAYVNGKQLNALKFVTNPFREGEKMYRTGDIVRWLPDGDIEFFGRKDEQVKIRGYRIEPKEIESCMLKQSGVLEAIVLPKSNLEGEKELFAYFVSKNAIKPSKWKKILQKDLPSFMIPACFVPIESLPLTVNGKIDKKALLELDVPSLENEANFVEASTQTEFCLIEIWKDVLSREKIGVQHNFFDLGGHSLKAISLVSRINKALHVDVPLSYLFQNPTIQALAYFIDKQNKLELDEIKAAPQQTHNILSSSQKRLFLLQQIEGAESTYNMPGALMIHGVIDSFKLELAFQKIIAHHASLRTSFEIVNGEIFQKIHDKLDFKVLKEIADESEIETLIRQFVQPFDLSSDPLIRVSLYEISDDKRLLLFDMHHIISDGISIQILLNDLIHCYEGTELTKPEIQYIDYALWQQEQLNSGKLQHQEFFWLEQLSNELPILNLPTDLARPSIKTFIGDRIQLCIGQKETQELKKFAKNSGSTLFQFFLSAYSILLAKYTGIEDIIVGTPVAGRRNKQLEGVIGMFINTLALRNYPESKKRFTDFLEEVKKNSYNALENQDYPFEMLIEKLGLKRDLGRNPIFDTFFSFLSREQLEYKIGDARLEQLQNVNKTAKFDLSLEVIDCQDSMILNFEYCTDLFEATSVRRIGNHFVNLLKNCIENPDNRISELEFLSLEEKNQLLFGFNETKVDYPREKTIHQLFEEQVVMNPNRVALVNENQELTYADLSEQVNRVAKFILQNKSSHSNSIVAVVLNRSLDLIIGLLGILKSGSAYLPIDPEYPEERISFMFQDSSCDLLLTHENLKDKFHFSGTVLTIEEAKKVDVFDDESFPIVNSSDLAYIIYTSGSTGKPKGVMIEHKNVVRLLFNDKFQFDFNELDVWTMFHSYCFDFSVWEMYGALLYGGKLVIVPKLTAQNPKDFLNLLLQEKVSVLNQTPGYFYNLMQEEIACENSLLNLRYVIFGGEALKPGKLKAWKNKYASTKLINMYGITETTVHVTFKEIGEYEIENNISNIGKPIPSLKLYVLDKNQNLLPIGIPGELCVSGDGLARGYLNRTDLTKDKFVDHPFEMGQKMYRSGDLAKILPNGDFEYLGRIDYQVKIRGYRIELGEIESHLLAHPAIKDAIVLDREDLHGNKYLCAYLLEEKETTVNELKAYLAKVLPDYMIPSWFIKLPALPLTSNGKVNRKELPVPENVVSEKAENKLPTSKTEKQVQHIWQEILGIDSIGINDNFFELGGHSLKAAMLIAQIHRSFNVDVPLKLIFSEPTIEAISSYIDQTEEVSYTIISRAPQQELYPISSAEKRIYILNKIDNSGISYNIPGVFSLEGEFDLEKLENAIKTIIQRHEILRSFYLLKGKQIYRKIEDFIDFSIERHTVEESQVTHFIKQFIRPFDLSQTPLLRVGLVELGKQNLLLFDMHHIVSDGVSMEILIREISALYAGLELSKLPIQYKDFAVWQNEWFLSEAYQKQAAYWKTQFQDELPVLNMPVDYVRPALKSFEGDRFNFTFSIELSRKIKDLANKTSSTPFMVLLSIYHVLLSKYSNENDIVIGTPVAGRSNASLQNLIGMFVNTLPLRNQSDTTKTFEDFVQVVKENAIQAFQHQYYPFEELLETLQIKRDLSRNPLFDYMFSYQAESMDQIHTEGLHLHPFPFENKTSKMDLTLEMIGEQEGVFRFSIEYATKIFKKETIERISKHFTKIAQDVTTDSSILIQNLELITSEEKKQILEEFNNTSKSYPNEKSLSMLFEEQVKKNPHQLALFFNGKKTSYKELKAKSDIIGSMLHNDGILPDDRIGIMLKRSDLAIVAMLGVLKSEGAYVCIDPDYPIDRINYIIRDSGIKTILVEDNRTLEGIDLEREVSLIELNKISNYQINGTISNQNNTKTGNLAYIIYTSGSTGKPKGVAIEQKSVVNLSNWFGKNYLSSGAKHVLQMTSLSFDVSVEESIIPLLNGASVFVAPKEVVLDKNSFRSFILENEIHIAQFVPATLKSLLVENDYMPSLKTVICGGEKLEKSLKKEVLELGYNLYNHYGPTETTVDSLTWKCENNSKLFREEPFSKENETLVVNTIENICEKYPESLAVETSEGQITYSQLNKKSNQLAHTLIKKGVQKDQVIGIMFDRSIELIIGVLAIMKAGAAYLPIDVDYPEDRIQYMLENSQANLLITLKQYREKIHFKGEIICIDDAVSFSQNSENPKVLISGKNLAYVIYTSGSTGKPKGVQIEHASLNNLLRAHTAKYKNQFNENDICTSVSNVSFDVSVVEFFTPLIHGAKLLIIEKKNLMNVKALAQILIEQKVTFTYLPASLLLHVYQEIKAIQSKIALNKLFVGVEPIKDYILENYMTLNENMQINNSYGPTEATVFSSSYSYQSKEPAGINVPIGKPIHNTRIYIVDDQNHLQAIGIPGELCIAGDGLARGYLNNPELTAEKFVNNPFESGTKMYRTGDLAKWLPDGNIEFMGRKDYQVKIRGFRIEPGEIESRLLTHPAVKQALVLDKEDKQGAKFLCAYIVCLEQIDLHHLRMHIAKELPDYMIPAFFVFMEQFPLTQNGKINRTALPEPSFHGGTNSKELVAPCNKTEEILVNLWCDLFEIEQVGTTDNFFEIGGNSLKIIALYSQVQEAFGEVVQVNDLFDKPTIRQLAEEINKQLKDSVKVEEEKQSKRLRRVEF